MTQTTERTLATREFSDQQIKTRIEAANQPGFGLNGANRAQLNMIYLLAKHYDVDPAVDITLYRDRPWFTIDGRIRLMKRHPQYAGYSTRPLSGGEKEAWGYGPDDLVVECAIRTKEWGEIRARGKVSAAERKANTPAGSHPSEMAEKRAIARCSRMAFGQDIPDEDEAGFVLEQRDDPVRIQANSDRYVEIFGEEEDLEKTSTAVSPAAVVDGTPAAESPAPAGVAAALERNNNLVLDANSLGIKGIGHLRAMGWPSEKWEVDKIEAANIQLGAKIARFQRTMEQEVMAEGRTGDGLD